MVGAASWVLALPGCPHFPSCEKGQGHAEPQVRREPCEMATAGWAEGALAVLANQD